MAFDMMNGSVVSNMRSDYDLPNANNAVSFGSFKNAYAFPSSSGRSPHSSLSAAEQAELEYELRYRGNMIVDQQRKIQQLEEELRQTRDQVDMMSSQLNSLEQDRGKDKKKPQSRYWTPEEHQRFLEALQKYGHKDVKSISMHVSTRNATQVRTHAQKYFLRLERERRKKEEVNGQGGDGYNSSSSMDDIGSPDHSDDCTSMIPISSLTLPGSPAVSMFGDAGSAVGTPPGTPGGMDSNPGTPDNGPGSLTSSPNMQPRRRRATSFITVAQARVAQQARDSVLVGLPPTWTVEDYDVFMRALLNLADKHEDISALCRAIREQYLPHHTPDEVELCYRNVLKNIKQKPIVGSPKRRRTNSRPEPLSSSLVTSSFPPPSFPAPPTVSALSSSFPSPFPPSFRSPMAHAAPSSPTAASAPSLQSLHSSFGSSPPTSASSSPLIHSHTPPMPLSSLRPSPYGDYSQLSSSLPLELPILSELNISGLPMAHQQHNLGAGGQPGAMTNHNVYSQQGQTTSNNTLSNLTNSTLSPSPSPSPLNPSSLWGSALPFSFDTLMTTGGIPQSIPLVSHN